MTMIKAIIFDYDGVLQDTFELHRCKIKEFSGIDLCREDYQAIHDGNFPGSHFKPLQNINWSDYGDFVYPIHLSLKMEMKIKTIITQFSKQFSLFVLTSSGTKNISGYLKNNDLNSNFKEVFGAEICRNKEEGFNMIFKKYGFSAEECLFVTDTLGDILEANKVQVKTIAVDFGFHDRKRLEKGSPYAIVSSFDDIRDIVKNMSINYL